MGFNLGAFAGGAAQAGMRTYTALEEAEQRKAELALKQAAAEREAYTFNQTKEADELNRQASLPSSGGYDVSEVASALPLGVNQSTTPDVEQREAFKTALAGMTPQQQEMVLRQYGKAAIPAGPEGEYGTTEVPLSNAGVCEDKTGTRRVGALETDEKKLLANRKLLAMQSGNPVAMKRAEEAETSYIGREKGKLELKESERKQLYNQKVDEYSNKQVLIDEKMEALSTTELKDIPNLVNKDLKGFGYTAKYIPAEGETPAQLELRDAKGKVIKKFDNAVDVQEALNSHMDDFYMSMSADLIKFIPDPKDRQAAIKDIMQVSAEKRRLGFEERRVITEEQRLELAIDDSERKYKTDSAGLFIQFMNAQTNEGQLALAKQIAEVSEAHENQKIGFEATRLAMDKDFNQQRIDLDSLRVKVEQRRADFEGQRVGIDQQRANTEQQRANQESTRDAWEKINAENRIKISQDDLQLNRDKFKEDQKLTPGAIDLQKAHVNHYNSDAAYRNAAAKELKNGNWKVLGADSDGTPVSYDSKTGKFARPDAKPIKDVDFFKKVTGERPDKPVFTAKDLLEYTQAYGNTDVAQSNGKSVKLKDLPPDQQAAQARAFFNGGPVPGVGLDTKNVAPAAAPAASAIPAAAAPAAAAPAASALPIKPVDDGTNFYGDKAIAERKIVKAQKDAADAKQAEIAREEFLKKLKDSSAGRPQLDYNPKTLLAPAASAIPAK